MVISTSIFKAGLTGENSGANSYEMQADNGMVDPVAFGLCMRMQFANAPSHGNGHFFRASDNVKALVHALSRTQFDDLFANKPSVMREVEQTDTIYMGEIVHTTPAIKKGDEVFLEYGDAWFEERGITRTVTTSKVDSDFFSDPFGLFWNSITQYHAEGGRS